MPGNGHVRFGRRAAETDQSKDRHRAAVRPHTEHPTREGKVFCCCVMDTFSRKIVGWSIDSVQNSALVVNALDMAIRNRQPEAGGIVHADHGVNSAPMSTCACCAPAG
jgi:transposase InsO family protein